jgi:predicted nuclease of predicted toxin-antitoxin system
VKFLVDANLPPRLCVWLGARRHEAGHIFDRNLLTATDCSALFPLQQFLSLLIVFPL